MTDETITVERDGKEVTLHRIEALRDFGNVEAGERGGYIESEANLSHDGKCWVYRNAQIYGYAHVYGDAKIYGNAKVYGDAKIFGNALVYDNAEVSGFAEVHGCAKVCGDTVLGV